MMKNLHPVVYLTMKPFLNSSSEPSTRLSFNKKCVFTHVYIYFSQECTYCSKSHPRPSCIQGVFAFAACPNANTGREGGEPNLVFAVSCLLHLYKHLEIAWIARSVKTCCITFARNMSSVGKTTVMLLLSKSQYQILG